MDNKYHEAIQAMAEIIIEQKNELKYRKCEIELLKNKIKSVEEFCEQKVSQSK